MHIRIGLAAACLAAAAAGLMAAAMTDARPASRTGLEDHQVALLVRGCARVSIAVLTMYDGSHAYGKATSKAIFARLLRGFPTARRIRAATAPSARARAAQAAGRGVRASSSARRRMRMS